MATAVEVVNLAIFLSSAVDSCICISRHVLLGRSRDELRARRYLSTQRIFRELLFARISCPGLDRAYQSISNTRLVPLVLLRPQNQLGHGSGTDTIFNEHHIYCFNHFLVSGIK